MGCRAECAEWGLGAGGRHRASFSGDDKRAEGTEAWEISWRKVPAWPQGHLVQVGEPGVERQCEGGKFENVLSAIWNLFSFLCFSSNA